MIVSHIDAFEDYMETQAWTWEHQALIRARPICGDEVLGQKFNLIRQIILNKERDEKTLKEDVSDMRERMRKEHIKIEKGYFDVKQGRSGVVDIEFLVQFLILKHAAQYPELSVWTDNIRLLESLETEGIVLPEDSSALQQAYLEMRRAIHRLNLLESQLLVPLDRFSEIRTQVQKIYEVHLGEHDSKN